MAKAASSEGALRVSRSYRETGRKRLRIAESVEIPFESTLHLSVPHEDDHIEINPLNDEDGDNDTDIFDTSDPDDVVLEDAASLVDEPPEVDDVPVVAGTMAPQGFPLAEIAVGFPDDDEMAILSESDDEEDEDDFQDMLGPPGEGDEHGVPRISQWRLNLTALSQVYNLYIVAYGEDIHISRPRSCVTNALPVRPDVVIRPDESSEAIIVGGFINEMRPHEVNHLIVDDFGNEEVLLLAYDDGDVIGFYTRHLEDEILLRERGGGNFPFYPDSFFHQNVGMSAWGLAVHKQSRIIAVSANTQNVYVFIFALTGRPYRHNPDVDPVQLFRNVVKDPEGKLSYDEPDQAQLDESSISSLENAIRRRDANWRVVLRTGHSGTNLPNVAFANGADGEADKIVAVDINGTLWLMDFWNVRRPHFVIKGLHQSRPQEVTLTSHNPRGWGVLVLPESSFLPVKNKADAIGMSLSDARYVSDARVGHWIDISLGINNVRNNSQVHPWLRWGHHTQFVVNPLEPGRAQLEASWYDFSGPLTPLAKADAALDLMPYHMREKYLDYKPPQEPRTLLGDGSSIMRTYELDIELRSFDPCSRGIVFEKVIEQRRPSQAVLPLMRVAHERLANLIHVPELSLVVAASLCGRVALVTLTRTQEKGLSFKRAFRVEAILPTKQDEDSGKRPICPLLGVAVGPLPFSGSPELAEKPVDVKSYRLMLHFYDLSILSYNISRSSATDSLSIS